MKNDASVGNGVRCGALRPWRVGSGLTPGTWWMAGQAGVLPQPGTGVLRVKAASGHEAVCLQQGLGSGAKLVGGGSWSNGQERQRKEGTTRSPLRGWLPGAGETDVSPRGAGSPWRAWVRATRAGGKEGA